MKRKLLLCAILFFNIYPAKHDVTRRASHRNQQTVNHFCKPQSANCADNILIDVHEPRAQLRLPKVLVPFLLVSLLAGNILVPSVSADAPPLYP